MSVPLIERREFNLVKDKISALRLLEVESSNLVKDKIGV